jgi:hypothetical protein
MKKIISLLSFFICSFVYVYAQPPGHADRYGFSPEDSTRNLPKPQKGLNKGRMFADNGLNIEMTTPGNIKKPEVSYFVYDSLKNPLDAKQYTGTVKYVFGNANQYIEVKLIPSGKNNQYIATLEAWHEYKQAIVTLKKDEHTSSVTFFNTTPPKSSTPSLNDPQQQTRPMQGGGMMPRMGGY